MAKLLNLGRGYVIDVDSVLYTYPEGEKNNELFCVVFQNNSVLKIPTFFTRVKKTGGEIVEQCLFPASMAQQIQTASRGE